MFKERMEDLDDFMHQENLPLDLRFRTRSFFEYGLFLLPCLFWGDRGDGMIFFLIYMNELFSKKSPKPGILILGFWPFSEIEMYRHEVDL